MTHIADESAAELSAEAAERLRASTAAVRLSIKWLGTRKTLSRLNVQSNAELDRLVEQARQVVQGVAPGQLRSSQELRQEVTRELSGLQSVLDGLLVDRPRRNLLRSQSLDRKAEEA